MWGKAPDQSALPHDLKGLISPFRLNGGGTQGWRPIKAPSPTITMG